jgi:fructose-bisphosphate aldolase class 1
MTDIAQTDTALTAAQMAGSGKGILAADERVPVLNRRLETAGVAPTAESRRAYHEMLVTTPHLSEGLSGIILFGELHTFGAAPECMVLRLSMVVPGTDSGETLVPEDVAAHTMRALDGFVPDRIGGIAFSSSGQGLAAATSNLAALLRNAGPWPLTFSFGRALAEPALSAWRGESRAVRLGQHTLANGVACNLAALRGAYRHADAERYALG